MRKTFVSVIVSFVFACSSLLAQTDASVTRSTARGSALDRLRAKIDVEQPTDLGKSDIIGHYTSTPDELRRRVVPLSGDDLYFFPDGSYVYYVWCDIPPDTIRDKGRWVSSGNELTFTSDSEITWNPGAERHYLLVRRRSHPQEILAVGMDRDLGYFEDHAKDDPEFMLLLNSKVRINGFNGIDPVEVKKKLMREAWRPKFYTSK